MTGLGHGMYGMYLGCRFVYKCLRRSHSATLGLKLSPSTMRTVRDLETVWRYQEKTVEEIIASTRGADSFRYDEYMAFYTMTGSLEESYRDIKSGTSFSHRAKMFALSDLQEAAHYRLLKLLQKCFARHLKTVGSVSAVIYQDALRIDTA